GVGGRLQGPVRHGGVEAATRVGVMTVRCKIRRNVRRSRVDLHRLAEVDRLPARGGFVGERRRREQLTAGGPQTADVRAAVRRGLVEPNTGDLTPGTCGEFDAKIDVAAIQAVDNG